ncbi:MAG TPA: STAS/SEC14 domain-containing protein [Gemmataceae bacterium]|nr:STAS/SEC14 domain-containing protein [Gemmataceae bacterium]
MIEQLTSLPAHTVGFKLSGKLHDEDYKTFVPLVDAEIAKHGKVNVLVQFHDFHGWDVHALWDDIKFATTHCTKIQSIALVGETTWE